MFMSSGNVTAIPLVYAIELSLCRVGVLTIRHMQTQRDVVNWTMSTPKSSFPSVKGRIVHWVANRILDVLIDLEEQACPDLCSRP